MQTSDREKWRQQFVSFAHDCEGYSPLYERLALDVAEDEALFAFAAHARPGQPPPNLLFAATHQLLLQGATHPLRAYYRTVVGDAAVAPDAAALPAFRDFCLAHEVEIAGLMRQRLVQTNEVGRSAVLLAGFSAVAAEQGGAPLALIDVGCSAGLNLQLDRFYIDYGAFAWGDAAAPVRLRCELSGEAAPPVAPGEPRIAWRAGVDLNPIDIQDPEAVAWLQALVWPELPERIRSLSAAIALAQARPSRILKGDAIELLPRLIEEAPPEATLCLYQSYVFYQLPEASRRALEALLAAAARRRPLFLVSMSGPMQDGRLEFWTWQDGVRQTRLLAKCMAHGQWLRWCA